MTKSKGINRPRLRLPDPLTPEFMLEHTSPATGGCREWTHSRTLAGYGTFRSRGVALYAHRVMAELVYGPPPEEAAEVLHSCDNPPCIEPTHLRWGGHLENMREARDRGRVNRPTPHRGRKHHSSKLSWELAQQIRAQRAAGATYPALTRQYGVDSKTIWSILKWRTWTTPEGVLPHDRTPNPAANEAAYGEPQSQPSRT